MKKTFRKIIRNLGWDMVSFDPRFSAEARKLDLLRRLGIDHVLDVGANIGQFGQQLRESGYRGRITSFEPMKKAYDELASRAVTDPLWVTVHAGLGANAGKSQINISQNSYSSSIRDVTPRHLEAHPDSATVAQETIVISTVDAFFDQEKISPSSRVMLKIDTQGYESEVLEGARDNLDKISLVVMEMSLEPLYAGQELLASLVTRMYGLGFKLSVLEACDEDYDALTTLQMDGWFVKTSESKQ